MFQTPYTENLKRLERLALSSFNRGKYRCPKCGELKSSPDDVRSIQDRGMCLSCDHLLSDSQEGK